MRNLEKNRERARQWRRENADKVLEHTRRYRASITKECSHPDGCLKLAITNADGSLCSMHYNRVWRGLGVGTAQPIYSDKPSYVSAHERVWRLRGRAAESLCVDCGNQASDWSYDHSDPDELTKPVRQRGRQVYMSYSTDVDRYDPRCRACHIAFDKTAHNRERGPTGRFAKKGSQ